MTKVHKKAKKLDLVPPQQWSAQLLPLLLFLGLGSLVAYFVPSLAPSSSSIFKRTTVDFYEIMAIIMTTALTVIYLAYYRSKAFFSTKWLIAAGVYNFLVLFVKFTLSSNEVSARTFTSFGSILATALLVSLLYLFALVVLYYLFDGRLLNKSLHKALIVTREGKTLLAMSLFVCVTLARLIFFKLPGISHTAAANYLGDVFKANNLLLSALLFVMIVAAVEAFAQVRRREDLKPFFVMAAGLIVSFHVWWAIFMFRRYM